MKPSDGLPTESSDKVPTAGMDVIVVDEVVVADVAVYLCPTSTLIQMECHQWPGRTTTRRPARTVGDADGEVSLSILDLRRTSSASSSLTTESQKEEDCGEESHHTIPQSRREAP